MPIWNYTSQFFANIYLNDLDKYILQDLQIKDYFRYVDDLLIFDNDYNKLKNIELQVDEYLKTHLNMQLAKQKTNLKHISHWLDFLGYFIKPYVTYTRKRVKHNFIQKLDILESDVINYYDIYQIKIKKIVFVWDSVLKLNSVFWSYMWHFKYAFTTNLFKKIYHKYTYLKYYFDKTWKKNKYLKTKKIQNYYTRYKYYEKLYKNTIIFYPINNYFVFPFRYMYLLSLGLKQILII